MDLWPKTTVSVVSDTRHNINLSNWSYRSLPKSREGPETPHIRHWPRDKGSWDLLHIEFQWPSTKFPSKVLCLLLCATIQNMESVSMLCHLDLGEGLWRQSLDHQTNICLQAWSLAIGSAWQSWYWVPSLRPGFLIPIRNHLSSCWLHFIGVGEGVTRTNLSCLLSSMHLFLLC
jgi:hypothetical protein